ncbi:MAG: c-type cytochrome [Deltaproteobacteria bacterium]|nr:c-type cytochrome [Deltaproteobacteria bacterium]
MPGFVPDLRKRPNRTPDWYLAYLINPRAVLPFSPMTSYGYLSRDEIEALAAFLSRLKKDSPAPEPISTKDIPETPPGIEGYQAGRSIFFMYCVGCHGESGSGGGPVGHLLSPEPRDFTDAIWMNKQTEAYLFSVTTDGKPDTAMPPFKDILTAKERALVIRYVQFFADPVARERMELRFVLKQ